MPSKPPKKPSQAPMRLSVGAAAPTGRPVGVVARVVEAFKSDVVPEGDLEPGTYDNFPLDRIDLKDLRFATREDAITEANTEDLAGALQEAGQINPIEVQQREDGKFVIVDGFRRTYTLREVMGRRKGKVTVLTKAMSAEDAFDRAVAENGGRLDNSVGDRVRVLRVYLENRELSLRKAAAKMGISLGTADRLKRLLDQPAVLDAVRKHQLGIAKAALLARSVEDGTVKLEDIDAEAKALLTESRAGLEEKRDAHKASKSGTPAPAKRVKVVEWEWAGDTKLKAKIVFDVTKHTYKELQTNLVRMMQDAKKKSQKAKS